MYTLIIEILFSFICWHVWTWTITYNYLLTSPVLLYIQDEPVFTDEECTRLQAALGLESQDLELILETSSFFLQQVRRFLKNITYSVTLIDIPSLWITATSLLHAVNSSVTQHELIDSSFTLMLIPWNPATTLLSAATFVGPYQG